MQLKRYCGIHIPQQLMYLKAANALGVIHFYTYHQRCPEELMEVLKVYREIRCDWHDWGESPTPTPFPDIKKGISHVIIMIQNAARVIHCRKVNEGRRR